MEKALKSVIFILSSFSVPSKVNHDRGKTPCGDFAALPLYLHFRDFHEISLQEGSPNQV